MSDREELIAELAALCGISPEYWDIAGRKHVTTIETKKAILEAMGIDVGSSDTLLREIRSRRSKPWTQCVAPVRVMSVNARPRAIPICLPIAPGKESALTIAWRIDPEERAQRRGVSAAPIVLSSPPILGEQWIDGVRYVRIELVDAVERDIGYYTVRITCEHAEEIFPGNSRRFVLKSRLILAPDACYMPDELREKNAWGVSINLYAVRSKQNWGVGDFSDLRLLVEWLAGVGGSFVGINPLHAIPNTSPFGVSPYAPISRFYRNFIYLDIHRIPDVASSEEIRKKLLAKKFRSRVDVLRERELIDYEAVAALKTNLLKKAFDRFMESDYGKKTKRGRAFEEYVKHEGEALDSFALFMALRVHMERRRFGSSWEDWPEEYRDRNSPMVAAFRKTHERDVLFHKYVQWLIDTQLKELSREIQERGLCIGLYGDIAVGSVGGGSDAWGQREVMASGADVGAPPDDFSPDGQRWGFPPVIPERLKERGYELFIRTVRQNMKYFGAVRIDHALGLFRLFWIPRGMAARDGAYVEQPYEDLLRIVALESARHKTLVVAEDLGTIGENVRESLKRFGMLSYRLFYFERRYPDPSFLAPEQYPEMALCAVTTHDLPTLRGFWRGRDIEVRRRLGTYRDEVERKMIRDRERDRHLILSALRAYGLIPRDADERSYLASDLSPELCLAIYRYLSMTPCKLLAVSLDDVIGTLDQQNLPGTVDEHPNWIQKMPLRLEDIVEDRRVLDLARALKDRAIRSP